MNTPKKFYKKIILIITFLALLGGSVMTYIFTDFNQKVHNRKNWEFFSPLNKRFFINFPSEPKEKLKEMNIAGTNIQFQEFTTEAGSSKYAVGYLDFPTKYTLLGSKTLLTKSYELLLEKETEMEQVIHQHMISHNGIPAIDYRLKHKDGKEMWGRLLLKGNTLYRVTVHYPVASVETVKPEAFIQSFQVQK